MPAGVIIDTSFLITLATPARRHHDTARSYWRHFLEQSIPIFLPTIVVSEFCTRQEITPEILRACVILPFNWDDAVKAASFDFSKMSRQTESRIALKDDLKIIAQALVKDAAWVITQDSESLCKFIQRLRDAGQTKCLPIDLADGFDLSRFNPSGQHEMAFEDDPEEPGTET